MKVLVTGGAGFIGGHLVRRLCDDGHEVVVLDDFSTGHPENLEGTSVTLVEGDVRDRDTVREALVGVEGILHHAALVSVPESVAHPKKSRAINERGTARVLEEAHIAGVQRVVFASSSAVYGDTRQIPTPEIAPTHPLSPYGTHKLNSENFCRITSESGGPDCVSFRYFNIYGPGQRADSPYAAVIPIFRSLCRQGEKPVIYGDGSQVRDFVFVGDVVEANMRALMSPTPWRGLVMNLGSGVGTTIGELAALIMELEGMPGPPEHQPARIGDIHRSVADVGRLQRSLGWQPRTTIRQGLEELEGASR